MHTTRVSLGGEGCTVYLKNLAFVIIVCVFWTTTSSGFCFDLNKEMEICAQELNFPSLSDKQSGYNFGYGSINDTEYMCQTKYHIRIIQCVRDRCESKCISAIEPQFLQVIWAYTFETKRFERASAYICKPHNLKIFRQHKCHCLRESESNAEQCSLQTNSTISEVVDVLKSHSVIPTLTNIEQVSLKLKQILLLYECKAMRKKFDCLHRILHQRCPGDAVQLIMNYFIESLPDGCEYQYGKQDHLKAIMKDTEGSTVDDKHFPYNKWHNVAPMQGDQQGPANLNQRLASTQMDAPDSSSGIMICSLWIFQTYFLFQTYCLVTHLLTS